MRPLKTGIYLVAMALASCAQPVLVSPAPIKVEPAKPPETVSAPADQKEITALALASSCAKASFSGQGVPPSGYIRGISLTFARAVCHPERDGSKIASQPLGDAGKDALAHYGLTDDDRLAAVYALMIGSAARESSWRWCVGKDAGASNTSAETCEAGLYQTSYNSRSASSALPKLFAEFRSNASGCFAAEYKGTSTCSDSNLKNWGTGDGVEFQRLSKACPGFATEYASVMFRTSRKHYGPLNTQKAEFKPVCRDMFAKIRQAIKAKPALCAGL